jgi:TolB-like protein
MLSSLRVLGQRKIAQWALAYAAGAWVALQAVSLAAGSYGWSVQVMRIGIGVALIGFLVTVVLAWYHGERGEQKTSTVELLILATLLAVGGAVMWRSERPAPLPIPSSATASTASAAPAPPPPALTLGVAVLPFANLSPDPDNAFFAGGVFEEVLTKLSHLPALRVISRTSMEKIAREQLDVREIGRRLGVSHVLEGSVRRVGDQVRVTVQLIEASTDNHVWAEDYDRKLDDVFAIQTEIALAISEQLKVKITRKLQDDLSERPTQDQAAYDLYLRAVENQRTWHGAAGFKSMIALLEPAVAADPDFLAARVLLAEAYGRLYWTGEGGEAEVVKARALVAGIRERWPDRAESTLAEAQFLYNVQRDYPAAMEKFRQLQAQLPNDLAVAQGMSSSAKRLDRHEEFLVASLRLQQLDPESSIGYFERAFALSASGREDEAVAFSERAVRKFPDELVMHEQLAQLRTERARNPQPMLEFGRRFAGNPDIDVGAIAIARYASGDIDGAVALLDGTVPGNPLDRAWLDAQQADLLQMAGRGDQAKVVARRSFAVINAAMDAGHSPARGEVASWNANAAGVALLAGEPAAAARWEAKARATPARSAEEQKSLDSAFAMVERLRGRPDAAWALLAPHMNQFLFLNDAGLVAFKPYYDRRYGDSAAYRLYVARLGAVSAK